MTTNMTTLFKDFEDDYLALTATANKDMAAIRATLTAPPDAAADDAVATAAARAEDRDKAVTSATGVLSRLKDVITNMEFETNDIVPAERAQAKQRVGDYRKTVATLERELTKLRSTSVKASEKEQLLARRGAAVTARGGGADGERQMQAEERMQQTTATLKGQNDTLRQAERLTVEMNDIADDTLGNLAKQRETINRFSDTTRAADEELSHVQQILRKMQREMLKNKLMLAAIIAFLLIIIVGMLYYKFGRTAQTHETETSTSTTSNHGGSGTPAPGLFHTAAPPPGAYRRR
jgi:vesicle transport through interaction with t-SNAREs protein 1